MPTYRLKSFPARTRSTALLAGSVLVGVCVVSPVVRPIAAQPAASAAGRLPVRETGGAASLVEQGDRESAARRPAAALALYEQALALDSLSYAALWKAAREAVDLGEFETAEAKRTSLYAKATTYARRAVAQYPSQAEGHFELSRAMGRTALALGPRDRIKYAVEVRDQAQEALRLNARHAGAMHVLGVWNAEVMRLNGFTRAMARAFLGGKVLDSANWADARRYLEDAVRLEPERLVHHLDLARIYRDMGRVDEARAAYQAAIRCPDIDANDDRYRQSAEAELRRLRK